MLVSIYNNKGLEDVLMISQAEGADPKVERKGNFAQITEEGKVIGYNVFNASNYLSLDENGPVTLTEEQVSTLNDALKEAGFEELIEADTTPKLVVGYVESCEPVEGSDHLNLTQTRVGEDEVLQIVCGASNIAEGQKVVVAREGAVMPDGLIIWPGELRGVKSYGMVCSAKELGIESDQTKGILVLDEEAEVGAAFQG